MSRIQKISSFLIIVVILSSCDLLNGPEPQGALNTGELKDITGYEALLAGVYNGPQNFGGQLIYFNDNMADLENWTLSFADYREVAFQSMTPNNGVVEGLWNQMYKSINESNIIIENIDKLENAAENQKANILGQTYFLRALMYYYLIQYYAKPWGAEPDNTQLGVPLKLKPVNNTSDFEEIKRASVKEVYDQIIEDLKMADGLEISNESPGRATNNAVTALRARIALIQEQWADAAQFAADIIPDYKLSEDVADYFRNDFGQESIFEIVNTATDSPGAGNTSISTVYNLRGRSGGLLNDAYKAALKEIITSSQKDALDALDQEATDTRVTELLNTAAEPPLTIDKYTHTDKYEDYVTNADNDPVLRLSEMILTRAEALAELNGVNQESVDLLNEIRSRAIIVRSQNGENGDASLIAYSTADFQNKEDLIDAIFLERSIELSFEGHRKTDLQRRKLDVRGTPWNADKLVFPIPQSQIDVSDIEQNPSY